MLVMFLEIFVYGIIPLIQYKLDLVMLTDESEKT